MAHKHYAILDEDGQLVGFPLKVTTLKYNSDDTVATQSWTIKSKIQDKRQLQHALIDALDQNCTHSYDCCGHWYRKVYTSTLHHTKRNEWTVTVAYTLNV